MVAGAGLLLKLQKSQFENKEQLIDCFDKIFSTHA